MVLIYKVTFAFLFKIIIIAMTINIIIAHAKNGKPAVSANTPDTDEPATTPREKKA